MLTEFELTLRVRYQETDPMGFLHHAHYLTYFELARTELLRMHGKTYREMEEEGLLVVVVKAQCRYRKPARYDDLLRIQLRLVRASMAKIEHEYHVLRDAELLAVGQVTLACIDREGRVRPIPAWLRGEEPAAERRGGGVERQGEEEIGKREDGKLGRHGGE